MIASQPPFSEDERRLLEARARAAASSSESFAPRLNAEDLVVVRSGADLYGFRGRDVVAVAALTRLSPLPQSPPHVAGLTSFRGSVLVVFHLYAVVGSPPTLSEHGRMVVLEEDCALAVDAVERIEALSELRPAPDGLGRAEGLVRNVTQSGVAVVDIDALLHSERLVVDIAASGVGSFGRSP